MQTSPRQPVEKYRGGRCYKMKLSANTFFLDFISTSSLVNVLKFLVVKFLYIAVRESVDLFQTQFKLKTL